MVEDGELSDYEDSDQVDGAVRRSATPSDGPSHHSLFRDEDRSDDGLDAPSPQPRARHNEGRAGSPELWGDAELSTRVARIRPPAASPEERIKELTEALASHPILAHLPRLERTVTAISKHFRQQFKLSDAIREAFSGASVRVVETERARLRTRDQKLPRSEYERRCALAEYIDGYLLALELLALRAGATEFKCCLANDTDLVYVDYIVVYADLDDPVIPVSKELSRARKAGASVAIMGPSRSASAKGVHGTLIPVVFGIWDISSLVTFTSAFLLEHHDAFDEILDRAPDERCVNLQVWLDPSALASGGPLALRYPSGGNSGPAPCHDLVAALAFIHGRLVADGQGNADLQLLSPLQGATPKLSEGSLHASMPMCTVPFDQLDLHLPFDDQEQELAALVRGSELLLKGHLRFRRAIVLVTEEQKATAQLSGMHTCELLALEDFKAFADGSSRK